MNLVPRYSLKQILLAMVGVALVMACLASAYRGSVTALCLIAGVVSTAFPLFCLGLAYWITFCLRRFLIYRRNSIMILVSLSSVLTLESATMSQTLIPAGKRGYLITIDDSMPFGKFGYSNIRVKLEKAPRLPVKKQEVYTVVVGSSYGSIKDRSIANLVIEPGESFASVDLVFPQDVNQFRYLNIEIKRGPDEKGRDLFSTYLHSSRTQGSDECMIWITSFASKNTGINVGIPERGIPTIGTALSNSEAETIAWSIFDESEIFNSTSSSLGMIGKGGAAVREPNPIHPENLPEAWIGFSGVTMIFITLDELLAMTDKHQVKCMALESWLAAGGTLVVFDTDRSWKEGNSNTSSEKTTPSGWKAVAAIMPALLGPARMESLEDWSDRWMSYSSPQPIFFAGNENTSPRTAKRELDHWRAAKLDNVSDDTSFLMHPHVQGRVFAVRDHFENWKSKEWKFLLEAIKDSGGSQGLLFDSVPGSMDSNMSIPGVGKPPLMAFQILMCLFVFAAGPGVYTFLKRTEQMQLFFFVVPVLAVTSCLGLLGYVVLIEGFGSYGRAQTVTWVDHRSQSAVTQARAMYYHGLTPAPYKHDSKLIPLGNGQNVQNEQVFRHKEGAIEFQSSDIAPRVPHHFVNLGSRRMEKSLRFEAVKSDQVPKNAADHKMFNGLGNEVQVVVFRTDEGWFIAQNVGDQQTADPIKLNTSFQAHQELSSAVNRLSPLDNGSYISNGAGDKTESEMVDLLRNVRGPTDLENWIMPGTYVAILEEFSEVDPMLQPVEFKHRLHVVVGRW